ncbi:MAG: fluoride efflux transporter CrcB [Peptoniphilaceae bacterium]|uniref:fluoride efflux transporter CrcB n=1 Tax=Aedoeadaptatus acetigenes TaxID=2981723 RepID=UPI0011DC7260|nr:fluoride efflux transporter CrcB [Aedoeadaptatus acetigenes]MBS6524760.1 fluoride efflux transporter CrcB [Peptoniphilaceae bacterium]MCU6786008.1 fluoride efflux transporter CrcB [Aedoeadaptatus acetigenes]
MQVLFAAAGGALGATSRFLISRLPLSGHGLPLPTFLANLMGCFLMGLIAAKAEARGMDPNVQILLKTGFCGGLTTFSTFSAETVAMMEKGHMTTAVLYVVATVAAGFIALYAGGQLFK